MRAVSPFTFILAILTFLVSVSHGYNNSLSFTPTSSPDIFTFTILQIADIHLGDHRDWNGGEWSPTTQDLKTYAALDTFLASEKADLILLTGDQMHANHIVDNATAYYDILGAFMESHATPWGFIFGNHDDSSSDEYPDEPARTTRRDLMQTMEKYSKYGVTKQDSSSDVYGVSNFVLNISLQEELGAQILLLDSGGGTIPEAIESSQLEWLSTVRRMDTPAVAFQHIPAKEYETYSENDKCIGQSEEGVYPPDSGDAGIVNHLIKDGNVMFMSVGHDHGNDYCCPLKQLSVCYGKHSGYGGYSSWDKGVRMFELIADVKNRTLTYKSWIRYENGTMDKEYVPAAPFRFAAQEDSVDSATTAEEATAISAQEDIAASSSNAICISGYMFAVSLLYLFVHC